MKILVVSDLPAFVTGGAEAQAARLIKTWLDEGHEVICLGRRMNATSATFGRHSIRVHKIHTTSSFGRWGRAATYFVSLTWLLLRYRAWADVVYTRFLGEAAATTALLKALRLIKMPLVATPASSMAGGDIDHILSTPLGRFVIRLLDKHCSAINLIAPSLDGELRRAGFSGHNFTRVPNGIPIHALTERSRTLEVQMIAVGRLTKQKGFDVLLRALSRATLPAGAKMWIVGDGPDLQELRSLAEKLGISNIVTWLGELAPHEVELRLQDSHLFILPSRYEGMSNAGLEAMERALPLIATQCGGLDAYIGTDMGWVVPVEDEAALATAIESAIEVGQEKLVCMGRAARSCVEDHFEIHAIGKQYLDLFVSLRNTNTATGMTF